MPCISPSPPHLPAPPPVSHASVLIANPVNLTRGTQGCPKITSFDKSNWHPNFWRVFSSLLFLCCFTPVHFRNTLCQKCTPFFHQSLTRESFSRSFFRYSFSPFLNECQLFISKDFWNLPVNPVFGVSLVLWRRERLITSIATPFYCPLSPNSQTSAFLIYSCYTFKKFFC